MNVETFDNEHHKFIGGDDLIDPCEICGDIYEAEAHLSFQQFSRDCDQTFGEQA